MCFLKISRVPPSFNQKTLKNRYTKKQPTHFSMTPLILNLKKNKKTHRSQNPLSLKKWRFNPKQK